MIDLKIKRLHPEAIIPKYATEGAACFDLHVCAPGLKSTHMGRHTDAATFDTGLAFEVPEGWVLKIYSRSGHGFKNGARLSNCVGVIDSDYRGQVAVRIQMDHYENPFYIGHGDRIAQAMLERVERVRFIEVEELSDTARGAAGFGSTGA